MPNNPHKKKNFMESTNILLAYQILASFLTPFPRKPLYLDALTAWDGFIPEDVEEDLPNIAPMLGRLGYKYDFGGKKPSYGTPDPEVLERLGQVRKLQKHEN